MSAPSATPRAIPSPGSATSCTSTPPDGGIPISCILTSASLHDSQAAIPLATMTAERVTNLVESGAGAPALGSGG